MSNAPFPIDPELTAIAIAYRNGRMIADEVLPRVPVGKQEFKFWKYDLAQGFTVPETLVGRKSKPNEVEFSATDETSSTEDHGLDAPVPQADIDNAPTNYNPLGHATEQTTNLILLDREARTSKLVFNPNSMPRATKGHCLAPINGATRPATRCRRSPTPWTASSCARTSASWAAAPPPSCAVTRRS
ncbi:hypothetical protein P4124_07620 [Pseudomonas aeruginosa]|nr:hypothetical protein [Pseudomonas aeruginosa]